VVSIRVTSSCRLPPRTSFRVDLRMYSLPKRRERPAWSPSLGIAMWPIRLAGAVPGGEPDGAESTAASHLAVREKRNGGGGRAGIRCIEIHRPRTSLVGIKAREYTTRPALGK
jgi:hypothetical protein